MFRKLVLAGVGTTLAVSILSVGLTATRWTTASALTNCSATSAAWNANETQLLTLINGLRQQNGLPALKQSPALANMAAWMAEDMAAHGGGVSKPPTHDDWSGRDYYTRAQDCGSGGYNGENVGWGFPTAQSMFNGWSASPGHRAAMLNANFKVIGIGQAGSSWAADFSSIDDSGSGGGTNPTNTPVPTTAPTQPGSGGNTPASGGSPTATSTTSAGAATPIPSYKLPSSFPIKRAMVPLISTE